MLPFCCATMPRSSRAPTWAIACTPKLFAGIAAVMKRDGGAWNVTLPASTRRRISSSSPSYQTCRLLLASNSRWLSKSTSTCSSWPQMRRVRVAYCGVGVIVGNPALHPDNVACCSCDVQRRLRNWSALSSSRRLRFMPSSAGLGGEGAVTTGGERGGAATTDGEGAANNGRRRASTCSAQARARSAGGTRAPRRPPGANAGLRGVTSGGPPNAGACAGAWGTTPTALRRAALVAGMATFSHLAAEDEGPAMKGNGISIGRILAPVLGGAALMSVISLFWNDQVLPRTSHMLRTLLVDIQRKKPTFQLKEQVINEVVPGQFFLRAARIDPATNTLNDVTIYDLQDPDRRRIIMADSGRMAYTGGGTDLYLTLRDGEVHEIKRSDPEHFNRTFYTVNRIKVEGVSNTFETTKNDEYRSDREMGICAMQDVVARADQDLRRVRTEAINAVVGELRRVARLAPLRRALADTSTPHASLYCKALGAMQRVLGGPRPARAAERV